MLENSETQMFQLVGSRYYPLYYYYFFFNKVYVQKSIKVPIAFLHFHC